MKSAIKNSLNGVARSIGQEEVLPLTHKESNKE
jgi:hypothetical protein